MKQINKQSGATLIVSLILLLVLTLVGVSAIEDVTLQAHMARNSQFQVHTYQVALSEINGQLSILDTDINVLNAAVVNGTENLEMGRAHV